MKKRLSNNFLESKVISCNDMLYHVALSRKIPYSPDDKTNIRESIRKMYPMNTGKIMVLFKFSDSYMQECAEFIESGSYLFSRVLFKLRSASKGGKFKFRKTKDKGANSLKLGRKKESVHYLLFCADPHAIVNMYGNIESLSNSFLSELTNIIYNNIDRAFFDNLVKDGVLDESKFVDNKFLSRNLVTDVPEIPDYDDPDVILESLPSIFSSIDVVEMIEVFINANNVDYAPGYTLSSLLLDPMSEQAAIVNKSKIFYDNIIKGAYRLEDMQQLLQPLYKFNDEDDDLVTGKGDPDFISDINDTESYSPLMEDQVNLVDIDEELSEDDPEYKNVQE